MELSARVSAGGRIVIPVQYRRALRLRPGDEVLLSLEDGQLRVSTPRAGSKAGQGVRAELGASGRLAGRGADSRPQGRGSP